MSEVGLEKIQQQMDRTERLDVGIAWWWVVRVRCIPPRAHSSASSSSNSPAMLPSLEPVSFGWFAHTCTAVGAGARSWSNFYNTKKVTKMLFFQNKQIHDQ